MLFLSYGNLRYSRGDFGYKLIVEVDKGISDYSKSLIPKWIKVNSQRYRPHISVVRKETPLNLQYWNKYEGREIEFYWDSRVQIGEVYCWLNVFSSELEEIRIELGLPESSEYTRPPSPQFYRCFHTTLGNFKDI